MVSSSRNNPLTVGLLGLKLEKLNIFVPPQASSDNVSRYRIIVLTGVVEPLEDSLTWAAAYVVPADVDARASINGPPMAGSHTTALSGSVTDTPHTACNDGHQEMLGFRFFVFRNLAISDRGIYRLQICIFRMSPENSPGTLG